MARAVDVAQISRDAVGDGCDVLIVLDLQRLFAPHVARAAAHITKDGIETSVTHAFDEEYERKDHPEDHSRTGVVEHGYTRHYKRYRKACFFVCPHLLELMDLDESDGGVHKNGGDDRHGYVNEKRQDEKRDESSKDRRQKR